MIGEGRDMLTYETFPNGPFYADLNIGESVIAPGGWTARTLAGKETPV